MLHRQFSSFLLVGGLATAVHYCLFLGLTLLFQVTPVPASLTGFVVGGVVNYVLNRRHTFETDRSHAEAGWRFALVAGTGFCITWALMRQLTGVLHIQALLAQIFTTGVTLVFNFIAHRFWTFRDKRRTIR